MKNNKHTVAFYQKQKTKLDKTLNYYTTLQEQLKQHIEAYMRKHYQEHNKPDAYSKASYDLMKYANREITRNEFISKYAFINNDNYTYYTLIQYGHVYSMLDKKRKEYKSFMDNFKKIYPNEVLVWKYVLQELKKKSKRLDLN